MTSILKPVVKQKTVDIENYVSYCSVNIKPNAVTFQFLPHVISEEENLYLYLAQYKEKTKYGSNTLFVEMKTMKTKESA